MPFPVGSLVAEGRETMTRSPELSITLPRSLRAMLTAEAARLDVAPGWLVATLVCDAIDAGLFGRPKVPPETCAI